MKTFHNVSNNSGFLNVLFSKIEVGGPLLSPARIEYGLSGIMNIQQTDNTDRFVAISKVIDNRLSIPRSSKTNDFHVIPQVLMLGGILGHFPEQTSLLSDEQVDLLAQCFCFASPSNMAEYMALFGDKDLLDNVCDKTCEFKERQAILNFIEEEACYRQIYDSNTSEIDEFKEYVFDIIKTTSIEELVEIGTRSSIIMTNFPLKNTYQRR